MFQVQVCFGGSFLGSVFHLQKPPHEKKARKPVKNGQFGCFVARNLVVQKPIRFFKTNKLVAAWKGSYPFTTGSYIHYGSVTLADDVKLL